MMREGVWEVDSLVTTKPRIVLAHGCFDLLHPGHIEHLQEARKLGDHLVVSVTADRYVAKGLGRPHFDEKQRAAALEALACVDSVVINDAEDAVPIIQGIRPAVYVKGVDYKHISSDEALARERKEVEKFGGRIEFTNGKKYSSSQLINAERFSDDVLAYIDLAKERNYKDQILAAFDVADTLDIAFVGEAIIDEYRYVRGLGRPSKEMMLAAVDVSSETFEGGAIAASRHAEWRGARWVTARPHIKKTRLVEIDTNRKLFDVYSDRDIGMSRERRDRFRSSLREATACSVVVVLDFGHGLLGVEEREILRRAKFLAVNAQTNAGNYGYNLITKYDFASLVCIDYPEARLAAGMADDPIEDVQRYLSARVNCPNWLFTHGKFGSFYQNDYGSGYAKAFTDHALDTMGAGDAVLATTAPLIAAGLSLEAAAFVGNVAGSIKTTIVGHRRHVGRQEITATIEALLA